MRREVELLVRQWNTNHTHCKRIPHAIHITVGSDNRTFNVVQGTSLGNKLISWANGCQYLNRRSENPDLTNSVICRVTEVPTLSMEFERVYRHLPNSELKFDTMT